MADKIKNSRTQYDDALAFTELSKESAGTHAKQYNNVYEKGALISACLDILLLERSGLQYGFKDLKHDLGVKYGADKYFLDNDLFNEIEKLTWPEIKTFMLTYVQGSKPIPYEEYFGKAGIDYLAKETTNEFTLGASEFGRGESGEVTLLEESTFNSVGINMGYKKGDVLWKINGKEVSVTNFLKIREEYFASLKEADTMKVTIKRKDGNGKETIAELLAPAKKMPRTREHILRWKTNPTAQQVALKNKWLNISCK